MRDFGGMGDTWLRLYTVGSVLPIEGEGGFFMTAPVWCGFTSSNFPTKPKVSYKAIKLTEHPPAPFSPPWLTAASWISATRLED